MECTKRNRNAHHQHSSCRYRGDVSRSNQLDFIELKNNSTDPVPLDGYALSKGINCAFDSGTLAPGAFIIATKNTNTFLSVYALPAGSLLLEHTGDLDNSDEKIALQFADKTLYTFSYSDDRNWPQAADGEGHSLEPLMESVNGLLNYGGNWQQSTFFGGSPGSDGLRYTKSIVINEVVAHTDTGLSLPFDSNDQIELYNASDDPLKPEDSSWGILDEVFYFDRDPWPEEADGTGLPLIRSGITSWHGLSI